MKHKTQSGADAAPLKDELKSEYAFDYSHSKPNRFAGRVRSGTVIVLDDDVASAFPTSEAVNHALRSLLQAIPNRTGHGPRSSR